MTPPAPVPVPGEWTCSSWTKAQLTDVAGAVYYKEGTYSDNSFGCWVTDYAWAFFIFVAAFTLLRFTRFQEGLSLCIPPKYEHTRFLLVWGLITLGMSSLCGGWYHSNFAAHKAGKFDVFWSASILCLGAHCSFYLMACVAMHQQGDRSLISQALYIVSMCAGLVFIGVCIGFELDYPTSFSLGSLIPLCGVLVGILLHGFKYYAFTDSSWVLCGAALNFAALALQWVSVADCANSCPVDCPYSVPNFNHNAAFHTMGAFSLLPTLRGFLGICYQLEDPDGMPYFALLRRTRDPYTHRGGSKSNINSIIGYTEQQYS